MPRIGCDKIMTVSPCKNCKERHNLCWDECKIYLNFKEKKRKEKEALKSELYDYKCERIFNK